MTEQENSHVILYDGLCNFCSTVVKLVLKNDQLGNFKFAPLQSKEARSLLREAGIQFATLKTIYLIENNTAYKRSTAVFRIFSKLKYPLKIFSWFSFLPEFITDAGYNLIARYRYVLFGKKNEVWIPEEKFRNRFLPSTIGKN